MAVRLGVESQARGPDGARHVVLPHGCRESPRVLVFAKGEKEREALRQVRTMSVLKNWPENH